MFRSLGIFVDIDNIEALVGENVADDRQPVDVLNRRGRDFVTQDSIRAVEEQNRWQGNANDLKYSKYFWAILMAF